MSTGVLDPLIDDPGRLRVTGTLAALPGGDAPAYPLAVGRHAPPPVRDESPAVQPSLPHLADQG